MDVDVNFEPGQRQNKETFGADDYFSIHFCNGKSTKPLGMLSVVLCEEGSWSGT